MSTWLEVFGLVWAVIIVLSIWQIMDGMAAPRVHTIYPRGHTHQEIDLFFSTLSWSPETDSQTDSEDDGDSISISMPELVPSNLL